MTLTGAPPGRGRTGVNVAALALCSLAILAGVAPATRAAGSGGTWSVTAKLEIRHVEAVAVAPDGAWGAAVARNPSRLVWLKMPSGRVAGSVPLPAAPTHVIFDASGRAVAVSYGACAPGPGPCAHTGYVTVVPTGESRATRVDTGSGAGLLAAVPGAAGQEILVADAGAGTVAEVDAATGAVTRTVTVGPGVFSGLAASPDGHLAAASSETAGAVWVFDLSTGRVKASGYVPGAPGPVVFRGDTRVYVGEQDGEDLFALDSQTGSVQSRGRIADELGDILYLPSGPSGVVLVGSRTVQEVEVLGLWQEGSKIVRPGFAQMPFGAASAGVTGTIARADQGLEALAIAPRGLLVLSAPTFATSQWLRPPVLGGGPIALACSGGAVALVATRGHVDVLRMSRAGTSS